MALRDPEILQHCAKFVMEFALESTILAGAKKGNCVIQDPQGVEQPVVDFLDYRAPNERESFQIVVLIKAPYRLCQGHASFVECALAPVTNRKLHVRLGHFPAFQGGFADSNAGSDEG